MTIEPSKQETTVAVVVPVYNRRQLLLETLDSIVSQTCFPTVVVVVDDGSTESVQAKLEAWQLERNPPFEVKFVRQENQGASHARNTGIALVGPVDLLHFLDSDDRLPIDFYARLSARWANHPQAVAVTCDRFNEYGAGQNCKLESLEALAVDPIDWILRHGGGVGSCSLLRRDLAEQLGGYPVDVPTGHDLHLFLRLARLGPWLYSSGDPVVFRRGDFAHLQEEGQLHRRYPNFHQIWAQVCEDFLKSGKISKSESDAWRRILARRWEKAGQQMCEIDEAAQAYDCYKLSLGWRFRPRVFLKLLGLKRKNRRPTGA